MKTKLTDLIPNPQQPRQTFDDNAMLELAQSIREVGIIQPVVVEKSPVGYGYIIQDGERRWRAALALTVAQLRAKNDNDILAEYVAQVTNGNVQTFLNIHHDLLSETTIPIHLDDNANENRRAVRAIVANVQRADLDDMELARAYQKLADTGLNDAQIAQAVSKSRSTVANARRLCKLPDYVQSAISNGWLSARTAQAALPALDLTEEQIQSAFPPMQINPKFFVHHDAPPTPTALFQRLAQSNCDLTSEHVRDIVNNMKASIAPQPCPDCGTNIKGLFYPKADKWIDGLRYCIDCKNKRVEQHNENLKKSMVARYCPRCGEPNKISQWAIAGKHCNQCTVCKNVEEADKFLVNKPQALQQDSPYAVIPCPRCGAKLILINPLAGTANCAGCNEAWSSIKDFHNEADDRRRELDELHTRSEPEAVGVPTVTKPGTQNDIRREFISRWTIVVYRATNTRLAQLKEILAQVETL